MACVQVTGFAAGEQSVTSSLLRWARLPEFFPLVTELAGPVEPPCGTGSLRLSNGSKDSTEENQGGGSSDETVPQDKGSLSNVVLMASHADTQSSKNSFCKEKPVGLGKMLVAPPFSSARTPQHL